MDVCLQAELQRVETRMKDFYGQVTIFYKESKPVRIRTERIESYRHMPLRGFEPFRAFGGNILALTLLDQIRIVFHNLNSERLTSKQLLCGLQETDKFWLTYDARQLVRLLRRLGFTTKVMRTSKTTIARCYSLDQFTNTPANFDKFCQEIQP
jgi:hypothetical protein